MSEQGQPRGTVPVLGEDEDLELLLAQLPVNLREAVRSDEQHRELLEIVLDLGRLPEARFPGRVLTLSRLPVTREELEGVVSRVGRFTQDNRAGIERTLHRISAIRNRMGEVVGLTCRVGRAIHGTVDILRDVIESGRSLLLLGRPGVGKTTLLREAARMLADDLGKRVMIVDTSNEIAGDGDVPHPGIGRARRMQVSTPAQQHAVMIEAVENHMPEVVVIDEIGTQAETLAARTIAERGVQLVATAHGNQLENLLQNPTLSDLVGGIQVVTLSDEEARRRGTQKSVLERKAPPTFEVLVEIRDRDRLVVHHEVAATVDALLHGFPLDPELRRRAPDGSVVVRRIPAETAEDGPEQDAAGPQPGEPGQDIRPGKTLRIFLHGLSRSRMERAIRRLRVPVWVVSDLSLAERVLTLKSQEKRSPRALRELQARGLPVHVLRSNTQTQMESLLRSLFELEEQEVDEEGDALAEAEVAVTRVFETGQPVELPPRSAYLRSLQHQLAERNGLTTESKGRDPYRHVVIFPL